MPSVSRPRATVLLWLVILDYCIGGDSTTGVYLLFRGSPCRHGPKSICWVHGQEGTRQKARAQAWRIVCSGCFAYSSLCAYMQVYVGRPGWD